MEIKKQLKYLNKQKFISLFIVLFFRGASFYWHFDVFDDRITKPIFRFLD